MRVPTRCTSVSAAVLLCSALLVILVVAGCGSTATGAKTYTGADNKYSFEYPASWETKEGESADVTAGGSAISGVSVYDPDGAIVEDTYIDLAQLSIYELRFAVEESMLDEIQPEVQTVLDSIQNQAADMKVVEALSQTTISGLPGFQAVYSFSKGDTSVTSKLYFLFSGDLEYQWTLQAASENWEEATSTFDALVGSLKISPTE